jgi:hypothetical protein
MQSVQFLFAQFMHFWSYVLVIVPYNHYQKADHQYNNTIPDLKSNCILFYFDLRNDNFLHIDCIVNN